MRNKNGIIALIFGNISIIIAIYMGFVTWKLGLIPLILFFIIPIIAIVFGGLSIKKGDSRGMGIAGVVLGAISLAITTLYFIFVYTLFFFFPIKWF